MDDASAPLFARRGDIKSIEAGFSFQPKFDADGLIPAIVTAEGSGDVLMFAWMNPEALARTIETGKAHFWSRSRRKIWLKGEESGNELAVSAMRVDCDQDALWLSVRVAGGGVACHTGAKSCFYRFVPLGARPQEGLRLLPDAKLGR